MARRLTVRPAARPAVDLARFTRDGFRAGAELCGVKVEEEDEFVGRRWTLRYSGKSVSASVMSAAIAAIQAGSGSSF